MSHDAMKYACYCGCGRMGISLLAPIGVPSGPVMHMWTDLGTGEDHWITKLCWNIEVAALEELRVRHTASRLAKVLAWGKLEEARALSKGLPYFVLRGEDDE